MSIRTKLLLLLLVIGLPPAVLMAWWALNQIDAMSSDIAASQRDSMQGSTRHYMREKIADIGAQLRLTMQVTDAALREQRTIVEQALAAPPGTPRDGPAVQ